MKPFHRNTLFVAFASFAALALAACGGGGGGTASTTPTASNPPTALASITGVAADGYLSGAKACLDLNNNKVCDANEPSATTDSTGAFTIKGKGVTAANESKYSVVVMVNPTTIDSDTKKAVGKGYTLTSPPGKSAFISPVTTMINTQMEKDGSSATNAEKVVKQSMGFTQANPINLFQNYIKSSTGATTTDKDFAKIHRIAQVTARILGDNHQTIVTAANNAGVNTSKFAAQIVNMVVQKVLLQLQTIEKLVATKTKIPTVLTGVTTKVSTINIKADLNKEKDTQNQPSASFSLEKLMLTDGGITSFRTNKVCSNGKCADQFVAENIQMKKSSAIPPVIRLTNGQSSYNPATAAWVLNNKAAANKNYIITSTGWVLVDENASIYTVDATTNSVTQILPGANKLQLQTHRFIKAINLARKPLAYFVGESGDRNGSIGATHLNSAIATFSTGALGFKFATTTDMDLYQSGLNNDRKKCWNPAINYVDSNTNCNSVMVDLGNNTIAAASKLTDLFTTSSTQKKYVKINDHGNLVLNQAANATSGTVDIYKSDTQNSGYGSPVATSTWVQKKVNNIAVIYVALPGDLQEKLDYRRGPDGLFFAMNGSFVRYGTHTSKGTFTLDSDFMFNKIAANDIKKNFKDQ